ncbi:reverse transcriptase domain-containing protein [Streptomyces cyaneofuscatus]|uniref:reverse transcriptase/maturase family protein n=1 Tax=Streptomyces cyaneofuscatus TaxID=66883 RepID=UPI0036947F2A
MQNAETVLSVIRNRGERGLPLERIYRMLFNPELLLLGYSRIYANRGAMTPGVDGGTADGMSMRQIHQIIDALRAEKYRWKPARRTYIPKKGGKKRPLGMPTWSDKLTAEVVRMILDAYYEPQFSDRSHGFRRGRGCHTALTEIQRTWTGTSWFIEGDISDCFGSLDHEVLLSLLRRKIRDERFIRLVRNMLEAGYLEDWNWNATTSGAPQGGIASPVLSNIYLHELDRFVETVLQPEYTRGRVRKANPSYARLRARVNYWRGRGDVAKANELRRKSQTIPAMDLRDPGYRRLRYVRYADDWLIGFTGPRDEAEEIKARVTEFLRNELRLSLSAPKTLVTNAGQSARFLGYEISKQVEDTKMTSSRRKVNGHIGLYVPKEFVTEKSTRYMRSGVPASRTEMIHDEDFSIVAQFGREWRGYVEFYALANNIRALRKLKWVMQQSMLKTLANKHKATVPSMAARYRATHVDGDGVRLTCFEVRVSRDGRNDLVARMGGLRLTRKPTAVIADRRVRTVAPRNEIFRRVMAEVCEHCGSSSQVEVHHVRKLADLKRDGRTNSPWWVQLMAARRRKTLVLCTRCHDEVHAGHGSKPTR